MICNHCGHTGPDVTEQTESRHGTAQALCVDRVLCWARNDLQTLGYISPAIREQLDL